MTEKLYLIGAIIAFSTLIFMTVWIYFIEPWLLRRKKAKDFKRYISEMDSRYRKINYNK